ncbi:branched-chain amino acid aminotransferase [Streptosporangium sp. NPDC004631]
MTDYAIEPNPAPRTEAERAAILGDPGFGRYFTDHMVTGRWTPDDGWHDLRLSAYAPITMDPAAAVLHRGQSVFEGFKAYRHPDASIWTFRPGANAVRFAESAGRLALPEFPVEPFLDVCDALVRADSAWVSRDDGRSLYIRPVMFAADAGLGLKPARDVTLVIVASPVGPPASAHDRPMSVWLSEDYVRAAPGGTGAAKFAGNHAASMIAHQEARARGCDHVVFLDAVERRWVEDLDAMNLFFVLEDGTLVTPGLSGTILAGVTRDSVLRLAKDMGHPVEERRVSLHEWSDGARTGRIREVFACGTAAVLSPIAHLSWRHGEVTVGDGRTCGPVASALRSALLDLQFGRTADPYRWLRRVV